MAWKEISRSIRSRIRGGVRKRLSRRTPPRLAFVAVAAFLDRSAAPLLDQEGRSRCLSDSSLLPDFIKVSGPT
jgi:hypothetical protein